MLSEHVRVVVPTRGRWNSVGKHTLRLIPDATLCVHESERDRYAPLTKRIVTHPDDVVGIAPIYQWILDNVPERCVCICTDDIRIVYSQVGFHKRRIEDPAEVQAILERTAIAAADAGARVWGFTQNSLPLAYANYDPFSFCTWTGGTIGIIGRELRYDTSLLLRADIDFCLQSLMRDRFVYIDCRYVFAHSRFEGRGGNAAQRSSDRHAREIAYLKRKWGPYLEEVAAKGTVRLCVRVKR